MHRTPFQPVPEFAHKQNCDTGDYQDKHRPREESRNQQLENIVRHFPAPCCVFRAKRSTFDICLPKTRPKSATAAIF